MLWLMVNHLLADTDMLSQWLDQSSLSLEDSWMENFSTIYGHLISIFVRHPISFDFRLCKMTHCSASSGESVEGSLGVI
jgi:hypothetical protein